MANKAFKAPVTRTLREKLMGRMWASYRTLCLCLAERVEDQVLWWYQAQAKLAAEASYRCPTPVTALHCLPDRVS